MKTKFHQLLRQYRALQIFVTLYLICITERMLSWVMVGEYAALKEWQIAVIAAAIPSCIAGLFGLVNSMSRRAEKDEHDND